ncbi:MAG: 3'(2'),5'-bisphosphate nucleotidase CysQ [Candidatus Tantalella remota]|nr:3'(2'),5'-bisphosphate nucleotidase CysQ [Candidatus Tantalella remota]
MNLLIIQVIEIAKKASEEILKIYDQEDLGVEYKSDDSPLTRADKASHEVIIRELAEITPDIPVISEESTEIPYGERKDWKKFWLVDPLDGTKEFIKRNGEFTVNIAFIENNIPVMGIIVIPVKGLIYYGSAGSGAFRIEVSGGEPVPVVSGTLERKPVASVSRSHLSPKATDLIEALGADMVQAGSALKFTLVAEGTAEIYPRLGPTWDWDTGAGHAIAAAAGAVVCDTKGDPLEYNKEILKHPNGFVVCVPWLEERALQEIRKLID